MRPLFLDEGFPATRRLKVCAGLALVASGTALMVQYADCNYALRAADGTSVPVGVLLGLAQLLCGLMQLLETLAIWGTVCDASLSRGISPWRWVRRAVSLPLLVVCLLCLVGAKDRLILFVAALACFLPQGYNLTVEVLGADDATGSVTNMWAALCMASAGTIGVVSTVVAQYMAGGREDNLTGAVVATFVVAELFLALVMLLRTAAVSLLVDPNMAERVWSIATTLFLCCFSWAIAALLCDKA